MTRKLGCALFAVLAWTSSAYASPGVIAGYVKDSTGAPQMGAAVAVFVSATKIGETAFTDSRGYYQVENLAAGTYQVRVTAASFLPSLREKRGAALRRAPGHQSHAHHPG
jgi:hypothetical protein